MLHFGISLLYFFFSYFQQFRLLIFWLYLLLIFCFIFSFGNLCLWTKESKHNEWDNWYVWTQLYLPSYLMLCMCPVFAEELLFPVTKTDQDSPQLYPCCIHFSAWHIDFYFFLLNCYYLVVAIVYWLEIRKSIFYPMC